MHIDVGIVAITLVAYVRLHHCDATSVIMCVDVEIVIITLVAYARRHYNATSVIITIFTSTHIITLVARGVNHFRLRQVSGKPYRTHLSPPHASHFS